jgi:hypothetical protein
MSVLYDIVAPVTGCFVYLLWRDWHYARRRKAKRLRP